MLDALSTLCRSDQASATVIRRMAAPNKDAVVPTQVDPWLGYESRQAGYEARGVKVSLDRIGDEARYIFNIIASGAIIICFKTGTNDNAIIADL